MIEIDVKVFLKSALHIGTGLGVPKKIDDIVQRDTYGRPYLPGSSLKGKTRFQAWRLAQAFGEPLCNDKNCPVDDPCIVCRIFGSPANPGMLYFDNLSLPENLAKALGHLAQYDGGAYRRDAEHYGTGLRSGIKLSRMRHSVEHDFLFTIETLLPQTYFQGKITGQIRTTSPNASIDKEKALLLGALKLITHLGGGRARGLGRCTIEASMSPTYDNETFGRGLSQLGHSE